MIIETACAIAPLKLLDYSDWEGRREEEFSRVLAANAEMVLDGLGVPYPHRFVQVESKYEPAGAERCDVVIDNSMLALPFPELLHKEHVECKFFRQNITGGNASNLAGSLWMDFRKVLSKGLDFPYVVVLCESEYTKVLPSTGIHADCVRLCFDPTSPAKFNIWDLKSLDQTKDDPFELTPSPVAINIQVVRRFTEPFPLKFGSDIRLYRISSFRLYVDSKSCKAFEF
jgi:hypothetical protein